MLVQSQYLRISVVNTCNLSCFFCHNEGAEITGEKLSIDELEIACRIAKKHGFTKFKLTGGEPTIRPDIVELVERLANIGLDDFSMITNGTLLTRLAEPLKKAGLQRINVSLHTLNEEKYAKLNVKQKVSLKRIIEGIDRAIEVGYTNMKINFVYTGEQSDEDLEDMLRFTAARNITLVVLPIMENDSIHSVTLSTLYNKFVSKEIIEEKRVVDKEGIAKSLITLKNGATILLRKDELSEHRPYVFCSSCSVRQNCREGIFPLRLSAAGELIPCLASFQNRVSIKEALQKNNQNAVEEVITQIKRWRVLDEQYQN